MSNNLEAWEADQVWLLLKRPDATEDQIEKFCESVAKRVYEGETENDARDNALGLYE